MACYDVLRRDDMGTTGKPTFLRGQIQGFDAKSNRSTARRGTPGANVAQERNSMVQHGAAHYPQEKDKEKLRHLRPNPQTSTP